MRQAFMTPEATHALHVPSYAVNAALILAVMDVFQMLLFLSVRLCVSAVSTLYSTLYQKTVYHVHSTHPEPQAIQTPVNVMMASP